MRLLICVFLFFGFVVGFIANWDYIFNKDKMLQEDRIGVVMNRPPRSGFDNGQLIVRWEDTKKLEAVSVAEDEYITHPQGSYYIGHQLSNDPQKWNQVFWANVFKWIGIIILCTGVPYLLMVGYIAGKLTGKF